MKLYKILLLQRGIYTVEKKSLKEAVAWQGVAAAGVSRILPCLSRILPCLSFELLEFHSSQIGVYFSLFIHRWWYVTT